MRKIYTKKKSREIMVNLLMATAHRPVKVNIIDSCERCYFLKKKKGKSFCTGWANPILIKHPKAHIIESNCVLFDYESIHPQKGKIVGKVTSKV